MMMNVIEIDMFIAEKIDWYALSNRWKRGLILVLFVIGKIGNQIRQLEKRVY